MRLLAVIPARGGSKGVPMKNTRPLAGKPLIAYTIEAARAARSIERFVVSTEDEKIARVSRKLGAEVIMRPPGLAGDTTPTLPVLQHAVDALEKQNHSYDAVVTLQPTSPLRLAGHIDEAAAIFAADSTADSLVSCLEVPHIFHPRSVMRLNSDGYLEPYLDSRQPLRRQDKETVFARNGAAIYITRIHRLSDYIFGGRLIAYPMASEVSMDIDDMADFAAAETILGKRTP